MSGLETAIRNALERSDRADAEIRARIYHSARQALDAGLRKQGVTDPQVVASQRQLLEAKIEEIETQERARQMLRDVPEPIIPSPIIPEPVISQPASQPQAGSFAVDPPVSPGTRTPDPQAGVILGGASREAAATAQARAGDGDLGSLGAARPDRMERLEPASGANAPERERGPKPDARAERTSEPRPEPRAKSRNGDTRILDVPPERAAKPRRRRSWTSRLIVWALCLALLGGTAWWVYTSDIVRQAIEQAATVADNQLNRSGGANEPDLDPQRGFSADWVEVFVPAKASSLQPSGQVKVETVNAAEGPAARIVSATPNEAGDLAIEVPAELLRAMAGGSSTIALTMQSGANRSVQVSVRCDFGSLGDCQRHRFMATQEKTDALFRVSFDRALAPSSPGRLLVNTGLDGADQPLLLYSVRVLPGQ